MIEGGSKANDDCDLLWRYTEGVRQQPYGARTTKNSRCADCGGITTIVGARYAAACARRSGNTSSRSCLQPRPGPRITIHYQLDRVLGALGVNSFILRYNLSTMASTSVSSSLTAQLNRR